MSALDLRRCAPLNYPRRRQIVQPLETALRALRQRVAQEHHLDTLSHAMSVGLHMDRECASLGMAGHFTAAEQALAAIRARAAEQPAALPYELHLAEIEVIQTAIDLHQYQLGRLGAHHYAIATNRFELRWPSASTAAARTTYPQTGRLPL